MGERGDVPDLSIVLVAGSQRARAGQVIDAISRQTAADRIELIFVDLASDTAPLEIPPKLRHLYLAKPGAPWWRARADAVYHASAPVVAFIEDHCFPAAGWADALLDAHRETWGAVGYAFTNANPETFVSRAALVNDYGFWLAPARSGRATLLPGNNISYKRELLLSFGDQLPMLLTPDFNLQEALARRGVPMTIEPRALAAHANFTTLQPLLRANYAYARLLAARRVQARGWRWPRRVMQALATPGGAPLLGALRLGRSLIACRGQRRRVAAGMPVYLLTHAWSALGEALGYVAGEGSSARELSGWELDAPRRLQ